MPRNKKKRLGKIKLNNDLIIKSNDKRIKSGWRNQVDKKCRFSIEKNHKKFLALKLF